MSPRNKRRRKRTARPWGLVWLAIAISLGSVGFGLAWLWPYMENGGWGEPTGREVPLESPAIPPEIVWLVPRDAAEAVPRTMRSRRPVVQVRRRLDGGYELLYWGNPIRRAYMYSVEAVGLGRSALVDSAGRVQDSRPLPVTVPARSDGLLPLQPVVPLERLDGGTGYAFAARISVRDASTGAVLCSADYLLCTGAP